MRNFQDTFQILKQSFISAFPICMTVPLIKSIKEKTKRKNNLEKRVEKEHQKMQKESKVKMKKWTMKLKILWR